MDFMPTYDVKVDPETLVTSMRESEDQISSVLANFQCSLPEVEQFANEVRNLDSLVKDECSELMECRELMHALTALQNEEQSLRVHCVQKGQELAVVSATTA
eukprot:GFYU01051929.1.p2 GENE.GFYU01051929.1~~GFYU01051929.1.p2  ORF type:complete len:102 (+),score=27.03 GFYU01051929.1:1-306(+)